MALKLRVAVVGLGSIGKRHARLLSGRDDVTVEVVESSPEALAIARPEIGDVRLHDSFDAMLATRPDVVWIATPTPLHAAQSIAALDAGCHVFCEKPMSDSVASARLMKEAADRSGRVFNVGFMWHFAPAFVHSKQLLRQGALGTPLHLHTRVGSYITLVNSRSRYQSTNPGSLFLDYSHQPDLFYWLLDKAPTSVSVTGIQGGAQELSSNPNVAAILYEYDAPLISTVHLNYVQMPQCHDYEIAGDDAWVQVAFPPGRVTLGRRGDQSVHEQVFPHGPDDLYRSEHDAFFRAVAGLQPPETSAADGLVSTAICEASIESWQQRRPVPVPLVR